MVIFSCRYFPQANFSVTSHPFLSVPGCYFLPSRCLLFQIFSPSAFPNVPSLSGLEGRELSVSLGMEHRQRLSWAAKEGKKGCSGAILGSSPNIAKGTLSWGRREELEIPWQYPQEWICSSSAAARELGGAMEDEGTPSLLLLPGTLHPPSSTAVVAGWDEGLCSIPVSSERGQRLWRGALSAMSILELAGSMVVVRQEANVLPWTPCLQPGTG